MISIIHVNLTQNYKIQLVGRDSAIKFVVSL